MISDGRSGRPMGAPEPPHAQLERLVHQKVTLSLKDHRTLTGRLVGCDDHLNVVLDETEEQTAEQSRRLGRVIVRGSSVIALHASDVVVAPRA